MSTTTRAYAADNELDFYETQSWATRALLRALVRDGYGKLAQGNVLDPFAGRGAILRAVREEWPKAHPMGIELDPDRAGQAWKVAPIWTRNALGPEAWTSPPGLFPGRPDLIVTNPPYNRTMDCVKRTLAESDGVPVAHLLAMQFLSSADRASFHLENPSRVHVLSRRPSFCATLKCENSGKRGAGKACAFKKQQPLEDERPRACPLCGGKVDVTTSDSATYAWFVWNVAPEHAHTWTVIPAEECR